MSLIDIITVNDELSIALFNPKHSEKEILTRATWTLKYLFQISVKLSIITFVSVACSMTISIQLTLSACDMSATV